MLRALKHVILTELQDSPVELTLLLSSLLFGFPGSSISKESPPNAGDTRDTGLSRGDLLEEEMATHSRILA